MGKLPGIQGEGQLRENHFLQQLTAGFVRNPDQLNGLLESDAELLCLSDERILAVSTDSLVEEIHSGLYRDPFLIGWMTVMAALSDLAAVGARPLGILLNQQIPEDLDPDFVTSLQHGVNEACLAAGTCVLGGDTNHSENLQSGATVLGIVEGEQLIMRKGCAVGDHFFASGRLGLGNTYAFLRFFTSEDVSVLNFQPRARLQEGALVRRYGTACIDSSDGFFPAIANLMEINGCGFTIERDLDDLLTIDSQAFAAGADIPRWYFLAGPHGEYELLFTIPADVCADFMKEAGAMNWQPLLLGKVTAAPELTVAQRTDSGRIDPFRIANLFGESGGDPRVYLQKLHETKLYEVQTPPA